MLAVIPLKNQNKIPRTIGSEYLLSLCTEAYESVGTHTMNCFQRDFPHITRAISIVLGNSTYFFTEYSPQELTVLVQIPSAPPKARCLRCDRPIVRNTYARLCHDCRVVANSIDRGSVPCRSVPCRSSNIREERQL